MTAIERIQHALQSLGLKAVEARLEALLEQAAKKEPSYADFLDELLGCEVEARRRAATSAPVCSSRTCHSSRTLTSLNSDSSPRLTSGRSANCAPCGSFTRPAM